MYEEEIKLSVQDFIVGIKVASAVVTPWDFDCKLTTVIIQSWENPFIHAKNFHHAMLSYNECFALSENDRKYF